MTASDVLELLRAGFTRDEIVAMQQTGSSGSPEQPAPEQSTPEQPTPEQPTPEQPAPEQPAADDRPQWAVALEQSINQLRQSIQLQNIRSDDMGDDLGIEDAAEQALAEYITGKKPQQSSRGRTSNKRG